MPKINLERLKSKYKGLFSLDSKNDKIESIIFFRLNFLKF